MDYKTKKQELVDEFNKNQQLIQQLSNRNQQIAGQIQLLTDIENESKQEKTEGETK